MRWKSDSKASGSETIHLLQSAGMHNSAVPFQRRVFRVLSCEALPPRRGHLMHSSHAMQATKLLFPRLAISAKTRHNFFFLPRFLWLSSFQPLFQSLLPRPSKGPISTGGNYNNSPECESNERDVLGMFDNVGIVIVAWSFHILLFLSGTSLFLLERRWPSAEKRAEILSQSWSLGGDYWYRGL